MSKLNTKKAISNIDSLFQLGEEISNAAPDLLRLKNSLSIIDENSSSLENSNADILNSFIKVIDEFAFIDFASFEHSIATGSTAVIITNSSDYIYTGENINSATKEILNNIKNSALPDNQVSENRTLISEIDNSLVSLYDTTFQTYGQWKTNLKSNSDIAKDLRLLIEGIRGFLKIKAGQKNRKEISWNKIFDVIGIQRAANKEAFLKQRKRFESLHKELSEIMKNIIIVFFSNISLFHALRMTLCLVLDFIHFQSLTFQLRTFLFYFGWQPALCVRAAPLKGQIKRLPFFISNRNNSINRKHSA